jgi:hypothetical protein
MESIYIVDIIQPHHNDEPLKVDLMIHNQSPGVELVSPIYAGDATTCCLSPDQRVNVGSMMQTGFNIELDQDKSIGVLMYKLQKKNTDRSNEKTLFNEDETTCIQFVVIWRVYRSGKSYVYSFLIEHDKDCIWDRDKLIKLYEQYSLIDMKYAPIEYTWLISGNSVLMTRVNVTRKSGCYKLEMTIAESSIKDDTLRPRYIDMGR